MARLFYQGVMTQFDAWHCFLADAPVPTSCLLPHLILAFCLSLTTPRWWMSIPCCYKGQCRLDMACNPGAKPASRGHGNTESGYKGKTTHIFTLNVKTSNSPTLFLTA